MPRKDTVWTEKRYKVKIRSYKVEDVRRKVEGGQPIYVIHSSRSRRWWETKEPHYEERTNPITIFDWTAI